MIRYRTGDLVRWEPSAEPSIDDPLTHGRLRGGILGRVDDMVFIRGNNVYPSALEAVVRRFREVAEYRAVVLESGGLSELRLELEPTPAAWTPEDSRDPSDRGARGGGVRGSVGSGRSRGRRGTWNRTSPTSCRRAPRRAPFSPRGPYRPARVAAPVRTEGAPVSPGEGRSKGRALRTSPEPGKERGRLGRAPSNARVPWETS